MATNINLEATWKIKLNKYIDEYKSELWIIVIGITIMNIILIFDVFRDGKFLNAVSLGQFGDFVGGYIGTSFTLLSVVLLFATLKNQRRSTIILNFENRYFELIKIHQNNVTEFELGDIKGRRIFIFLIIEFRIILETIRKSAKTKEISLSNDEKFHIAYYILFYGLGRNSKRITYTLLKKYTKPLLDEINKNLQEERTKNDALTYGKLNYSLFEGHQSRLGHYYRHLYQTVCFVNQQNFSLNKYEYVKTIRSQLTNHEQALLLINSLSPVGKSWWEKNLMIEYKMVQNLPIDFFDKATEFDVSTKFADDYFEHTNSEKNTK